jgi:hypothetical protein
VLVTIDWGRPIPGGSGGSGGGVATASAGRCGCCCRATTGGSLANMSRSIARKSRILDF